MGLFLKSRGAKNLLLDPLLAEATLAVNDVLGKYCTFIFYVVVVVVVLYVTNHNAMTISFYLVVLYAHHCTVCTVCLHL